MANLKITAVAADLEFTPIVVSLTKKGRLFRRPLLFPLVLIVLSTP